MNRNKQNHRALSLRYRSLVRLAAVLLAVLIGSLVSEVYYFRIDLTTDKRYTLQPFTRKFFDGLPDRVFVKVYLDGDLPLGFTRMRKAILETLDEFRIVSDGKFEYEFVNPYRFDNPKKQKAFLSKLYEKGLQPTNVQVRKKDGGQTTKLIFPGMLVNYGGKELAVNLLRNNQILSPEENINLSVQNFEFALVDAVYKLQIDTLPHIAFIHGHGELDEYQTGDIERELSAYFRVDRVRINGDWEKLKPYRAIIVAGPAKPLPEADKFAIDQFIMRGGKVIWFIDPVSVSIDSLSTGATTLAFVRETNLEDMLFKYGVRLNPTLLQDLQCAVIPVNMAVTGQNPRFVPAPWVYYPLLNPPGNHPVTRGINLILSRFASPLDTVKGDGSITKTPLLRTSDLSRIVRVPIQINLSQINRSPNRYNFRSPNQLIAVELSGSFNSIFRYRPIKQYFNGKPVVFLEKSVPTSQIVVADADIIRNDVQRRPNGAYVTPLGYDRFTKQTYGNRDLVVNMVKYLLYDPELMSLRSREFKLRLLNRKAISSGRLTWQLINLLLPPLALILGGLAWLLVRKRLYKR